MPTLDDAPILPTMANTDIADGDLIQVFDVSREQCFTITFAELVAAVTAAQAP